MIINILQDAFFAARAAIGFASISNPPKTAYAYCAVIAAVGHSTRYVLMNNGLFSVHIIVASTLAAFVIGMLAVFLAPRAKCPAETCFFPALLPMIPGMYAYRSIAALLLCLYNQQEAEFMHDLYLLAFNSLNCVFIVMGMVIGATIPVFVFKKISFQATRNINIFI